MTSGYFPTAPDILPTTPTLSHAVLLPNQVSSEVLCRWKASARLRLNPGLIPTTTPTEWKRNAPESMLSGTLDGLILTTGTPATAKRTGDPNLAVRNAPDGA